MTRKRQKEAGVAGCTRSQDGADSAAEEAAKAGAAYQKRLEILAKLEQFARTEEAGRMMQGAEGEVTGGAVDSVEQTGEQAGAQREVVESESCMAPTITPAISNAPLDKGAGLALDCAAQLGTVCIDEPAEPTLRDIFSAILSCKTALTTLTAQVDGLKGEVSSFRSAMHKMEGRVELLEERVGGAEDQIAEMTKREKKYIQRISELELKTDDLENRSRRNNLRIVGVPEKAEGNNPTEFIETWLKTKVGGDSLTKLFAVERAHRVTSRPLPPGSPPRTFLAKILNYRDRDILMRKARNMEELTIDGNRVSIYPDYSTIVQRLRMKFGETKRRLRELGLAYSMLYPAKLRVVAMDKVHFFQSPEEVSHWLDLNAKRIEAEGNR